MADIEVGTQVQIVYFCLVDENPAATMSSRLWMDAPAYVTAVRTVENESTTQSISMQSQRLSDRQSVQLGTWQ
jgi:hypothetical protein